MMKRFNLISLSMVALMSLVGCGGGGGDSTDNNNNTVEENNNPTGYYIDTAVQGVDYHCGTQTGTTNADGSFSYQEGQGCHFSVAGVPLRSVDAADLEEEVTIFENDIDTARFLQSIDSDGNASNGIVVSSETREAIDTESDTALPVGNRLESIVAEIGGLDEDFSGHVIPEEGVELHLLSNLRNLLAGKTYYAYDEGEGIPTVYSITFNGDLSHVTVNQRDYVEEGDDHAETREMAIEIISVNTLRISGDENRDIMVRGSLSTIQMQSFPHGHILDILYTTEDAAVAAG
jgi:hypothetical protein